MTVTGINGAANYPICTLNRTTKWGGRAFSQQIGDSQAVTPNAGKRNNPVSCGMSKDNSIDGAVTIAEREEEGEFLGLTMIPEEGQLMTYGMRAMLPESSTPENPIVQVVSNLGGKKEVYNVEINKVDPRNASQIEMFALSSYADKMGLSNGETFGSYEKMKRFAENAQYNGYCDGITDSTEFMSVSRDWIKILQMIMKDYFGNPASYAQGLECQKLIAGLEKWQKGSDTDIFSQNPMDKSLVKERSRKTERADLGMGEVSVQPDRQIERSQEKAGPKEESEEQINRITANYTKISSENSWTDPDTNQKHYSAYNGYTIYTKEGICYLQSGGNTRDREYSDRVQWTVKFDSEDDYERAINFINRFSESDSKDFAANEDFWRDFVAGKIDEDKFMEYYATLDHGKANFLKADEHGKSYIDKEMIQSDYFYYFGVHKVKSVSMEDLWHGLEESALAERRGEVYKLPETGMTLREAFHELIPHAEDMTFGFMGEDGTYDLQEWIEELIERSRGEMLERLAGKA